MRSIKVLLAVGAVVIATLVTASTAQGHNVTVCEVHNGGATGCVRNHQWLYVCDWQVDGHKAYIKYETYWAWLGDQFFGYAPSGGCLPANGWAGTTNGIGIKKFVVCVQNEKCSPVRYP